MRGWWLAVAVALGSVCAAGSSGCDDDSQADIAEKVQDACRFLCSCSELLPSRLAACVTECTAAFPADPVAPVCADCIVDLGECTQLESDVCDEACQ